SKTYDHTTGAAATPLVTKGTLYDPASLSETYDTKDVGTGEPCPALAVINDGVSGGDYSITYVDDTTGVISAEAITVSAQHNSKRSEERRGGKATRSGTGGSQ